MTTSGYSHDTGLLQGEPGQVFLARCLIIVNVYNFLDNAHIPCNDLFIGILKPRFLDKKFRS